MSTPNEVDAYTLQCAHEAARAARAWKARAEKAEAERDALKARVEELEDVLRPSEDPAEDILNDHERGNS